MVSQNSCHTCPHSVGFLIRNEAPRHLFLYNPDALTQLAEQHGLQRQSVELSAGPKILLNSLDYILQNRGRPSERIRSRRLLARAYVWMAQRSGKGDVIHARFVKPVSGD